MKLFLDTANIQEIADAASLGLLDGVTTNPTLVALEGVDFESRVKAISKLVNGPVSAEVISLDYEGMIKEGLAYSKWAKNICVKLPMTPNGLKACRYLRSKGIHVNITLVFSANQALLAAKAGATFVSPFIGRLDDAGQDGMTLIEEITDIYREYEFKTEIIVASVRHPRHVTEAAILGAHICTIPYAIFMKLFQHPLTDIGIQKFLADWEKASKTKGLAKQKSSKK
ncbi:MAG: fructose-6-phosphate aldolase [Candidatus Peregrinibacteria bacterium]|nr:fructose-6-phosphate aldolase [Candidatus Peregrinibacteria bacterium]